MPPSYAAAGIGDVSEFYATKFASTEILDPRYFRPLDRFDMHFARTLWVYDNVREGSSLLDIGCGAGLLALLRRKDVNLSGVDISDACVEAAKTNGYDDVRRGDLTALPFDDSSFDYVASLDVIGHVSFDEKDQVIAEIKRVLKPDGVTLHGIECTDPYTHRPYAEMTPDELRSFADVDGHIGLESAQQHAARFGKYFSQVLFEPRYALCLSSEEFLKQADGYKLPYEADFLDYLRGLSHAERRAFDLAMGYVFNKISDLHVKLPESGLYTFLKASNVELGPFYNEHRDRRNLLPVREQAPPDSETTRVQGSRVICLDHTSTANEPINAEFGNGWYAPDDLPPVARWMGKRSKLRFTARTLVSVSFELMTHIPELSATRPLEIAFFLNDHLIGVSSLSEPRWTRARFEIPEDLRSALENTFELSIYASRTFQPNLVDQNSVDDRELSVAVHNIEIKIRD
ncbi:MAG TPA: methyltransferase domain-containing protein [Pyrinomonadaceae bacterium]|nr:methyltransferase domain-containing protein [Pyrinomonadaceae bacterium]